MTSNEAVRHVPTLPYDSSVTTYTQFAGYYEPYEYSGWVDESMSWKQTCYLGDWSGLGKLRVRGPEALRFFADHAGNGFDVFDIGQAKHLALCNEDGKVMGDGILLCLGIDEFLFTSGPGVVWLHYRLLQGSYDLEFELVTEQHTIQQVQGPTSLALLEEATGEDLRDIGFMRFREVEIAGMRVLLLRQGMAGEIGYELHGAWGEGAAVAARLLEVGEKFGIRRLGGRTKMVNHVEAAFPTPSVDYIPAWFDSTETAGLRAHTTDHTWQRQQRRGGSFDGPLNGLYFSPVELGWARSLRFDHDFLGSEALRAEVANPRRVLRTLVWDAGDVADVVGSLFRRDAEPYRVFEWPRGLLGRVDADHVRRGDRLVGVSTSRCYSYFFREMLSLAVVDAADAAIGTELEVTWGEPGQRQRAIRAVVQAAPYKTDNRRADVRSK